MDIEEAEKHFTELVDKVEHEGVSIDLERDHKIVARLSPIDPASKKKTFAELIAFLQEKKFLGDDAEQFKRDCEAAGNEPLAEERIWD